MLPIVTLEGEDLRHLPLIEREKRLWKIRPAVQSRVMFLDGTGRKA